MRKGWKRFLEGNCNYSALCTHVILTNIVKNRFAQTFPCIIFRQTFICQQVPHTEYFFSLIIMYFGAKDYAHQKHSDLVQFPTVM